MKKIFALVLALVMMLTFAACGSEVAQELPGDAPQVDPNNSSTSASESESLTDFAVAMITDFRDVTDKSFNQSTYEACMDFCDANNISFAYFRPANDGTDDRIAMIEKAVDEGYSIIVLPGSSFEEAVKVASHNYPEIKFLTIDLAAGLENTYGIVFQEEIAGYLAGYAAVKLGYTNLGFLGGMEVPAVVRYGNGFVQGADDAASDLEGGALVKFAYCNQFFGDEEITADMADWYANGVQAVFACGATLYTSAAEAAVEYGGKVIGVDVNQAPIIDELYGEGMTLTSAQKNIYTAVFNGLSEIILDGKWDEIKGTSNLFGLVSADDLSANYVGIPVDGGTQFGDTFTEEDIKVVVSKILSGEITIDDSVDIKPEQLAENCTVENLGLIKE